MNIRQKMNRNRNLALLDWLYGAFPEVPRITFHKDREHTCIAFPFPDDCNDQFEYAEQMLFGMAKAIQLSEEDLEMMILDETGELHFHINWELCLPYNTMDEEGGADETTKFIN